MTWARRWLLALSCGHWVIVEGRAWGALHPTRAPSHAWCEVCGLRYRPEHAIPVPEPIEEEDDACPEDPDGLHHVGCGCEAW